MVTTLPFVVSNRMQRGARGRSCLLATLVRQCRLFLRRIPRGARTLPAQPATLQIRTAQDCGAGSQSPDLDMITSLVPLALALVTATSPVGPDASCIAADCLDGPMLQGPPGQTPPQKEVEKGAENPKPKSVAPFEGEPLRNRGLRSVPPVAAEPFNSSHVTVMRDLGLVIAGAEPKIVYISAVLPSGIGSQVDIRPNDVIVTLNGEPIGTTQSFESRFARLPNGSPVEISLRRGSQRLQIAFYKPSERNNARPVFPNDRPGSILPD